MDNTSLDKNGQATKPASRSLLSVEGIMDQIRARTGSRSAISGKLSLVRPANRVTDDDLKRSLQQAMMLSGILHVDPKLGWKTPIIGHAWRIVRRRIHQEIRIYIDALTRQQNGFNSAILKLLTQLVERERAGVRPEQVDAQNAEIATLRAELVELRVEIAALRQAKG